MFVFRIVTVCFLERVLLKAFFYKLAVWSWESAGIYLGESPYLFGPILLSKRLNMKTTSPQMNETEAETAYTGFDKVSKIFSGFGFRVLVNSKKPVAWMYTSTITLLTNPM